MFGDVVGELQRKRTLAASRGFLAAARLSCSSRWWKTTAILTGGGVLGDNSTTKYNLTTTNTR